MSTQSNYNRLEQNKDDFIQKILQKVRHDNEYNLNKLPNKITVIRLYNPKIREYEIKHHNKRILYAREKPITNKIYEVGKKPDLYLTDGKQVFILKEEGIQYITSKLYDDTNKEICEIIRRQTQNYEIKTKNNRDYVSKPLRKQTGFYSKIGIMSMNLGKTNYNQNSNHETLFTLLQKLETRYNIHFNSNDNKKKLGFLCSLFIYDEKRVE